MIARLLQLWPAPQPAPRVTPVLAQACASLLLQDCDDHEGRVLRLRVADARTVQEMRLLRANAFDCIARRWGEQVAGSRIRQLDQLIDNIALGTGRHG